LDEVCTFRSGGCNLNNPYNNASPQQQVKTDNNLKSKSMGLTPTTANTGFLDAGKTTSVKYIMKKQSKWKICVLENEFEEILDDEDSLAAPNGLIANDPRRQGGMSYQSSYGSASQFTSAVNGCCNKKVLVDPPGYIAPQITANRSTAEVEGSFRQPSIVSLESQQSIVSHTLGDMGRYLTSRDIATADGINYQLMDKRLLDNANVLTNDTPSNPFSDDMRTQITQNGAKGRKKIEDVTKSITEKYLSPKEPKRSIKKESESMKNSSLQEVSGEDAMPPQQRIMTDNNLKSKTNDLSPVTVNTAFSGAGKTTSVTYMIKEQSKWKICSSENELGEGILLNDGFVADSLAVPKDLIAMDVGRKVGTSYQPSYESALQVTSAVRNGCNHKIRVDPPGYIAHQMIPNGPLSQDNSTDIHR
jgi:CobW/HypB/UreG, nucleotide-binding domain